MLKLSRLDLLIEIVGKYLVMVTIHTVVSRAYSQGKRKKNENKNKNKRNKKDKCKICMIKNE